MKKKSCPKKQKNWPITLMAIIKCVRQIYTVFLFVCFNMRFHSEIRSCEYIEWSKQRIKVDDEKEQEYEYQNDVACLTTRFTWWLHRINESTALIIVAFFRVYVCTCAYMHVCACACACGYGTHSMLRVSIDRQFNHFFLGFFILSSFFAFLSVHVCMVHLFANK